MHHILDENGKPLCEKQKDDTLVVSHNHKERVQMKKYEIPTVVTVTSEEINDIMVTALEGGITYWCDKARISKKPDEDYEFLSDALTSGGTLELLADEEWYELTLEALLKALSEAQFDFENYDAGDVDNVVQKAVFGDVIYG